MNFLRGIGQMKDLMSNEQAQQLFSAASRVVSDYTSSAGNKAEQMKIEVISDARLKKMLKLDNLTQFSCHSESSSSGAVFYAIFLPESKAVWKANDEKSVRQLCAKLNPITDVSKDKSKCSARLASLMGIVGKEPDWAAIHYAVACGFTTYLTAMIQKDKQLVLNYATCDGRFPLNIAAATGQIESLRLLLQAGAPLNQQDALGRTVVHWAAATNVHVLQELSPSPQFQGCLLLVDGDGHSPLASAIRAVNFESVRLLIGLSAPLGVLSSGPLLNAIVGLKFSDEVAKILELITTVSPSVVEQIDGNGRTVLHKPLDKKVMMSVLRKSHPHIDINRKDKLGNTALQLAVERGELDCVVGLLTYGADPNSSDSKGETPLMRAVATGNVIVVKCLLLFGAKLEGTNSNGEDVFKYAESSKKRVEVEAVLNLCRTGAATPQLELSPLDDFSQKLSIEYRNKPEKTGGNWVNILSLDGGGIRGLVLIQMLLELESRLGREIFGSFQWVAGTSTGAILALALSQGKSAAHCRNLYFRLKDDVFTGPRPFNSSSLENLLKEEYGEKLTMDKVAQNGKRVMVTTCLANVSPPEQKLLRSYRLPVSDAENEQMGYGNPAKTPVWFAARCSSAAPTFFSAVEGKWMDGGLVANNPCCELLTDVHNHNTACRMKGDTSAAVRVGCIVSLGTGRGPPVSVDTVDLAPPTGIVDMFKKFGSVLHLKHMLIEQIACADGVAVSRARAWSQSLPAPFYRFSPRLSRAIELDETDDATLIEMMWTTKVYMAGESYSVQQLLQLLEIQKE